MAELAPTVLEVAVEAALLAAVVFPAPGDEEGEVPDEEDEVPDEEGEVPDEEGDVPDEEGEVPEVEEVFSDMRRKLG
ncbi:MAG TPA: hypothetical protein VG496_09840, partial [Myxococcales bacterium]|nr:hypothetical protein [Myxococcales bacterium]